MNTLKLINFIFLLVFCTSVFAESQSEKSNCEINSTLLTVYKKNDFKILSKSCDSEDNPFIENILQGYNTKIFLNEYSMDGGEWPQKLEAVSIYRKKNKPPILITLHTQKWCCYPSPEGEVYSIDLYEITRDKNSFKLKDIGSILGDDQGGLDGVSDDYMHFKLKNIALIKKWLDKNYK